MSFNLFKTKFKKSLGVDIGASSIKIIELSKQKEGIKLENYGEIKAEVLHKEKFRVFENNILTISCENISKGIRAILEETKIEIKKANFSIPDFASFFTTFSLPKMTDKELASAIKFEAKRHIPISSSEVTLDWEIIKDEKTDKQNDFIKILLVAVSNKIISQYKEMARLSFLELQNLEAETFSLLRATVKSDKPMILLDIGEQSIAISVVDKNKLKTAHSLDIAGESFTNALKNKLNIDYKTAEELKRKNGLLPINNEARDALLPLVELIAQEIARIKTGFLKTQNKKIEKIILAGKSAALPGLKEFFAAKLQTDAEIANPFSDIIYPDALEQDIQKIGPGYSVALGVALRGIE
ncbi:MAG: type IV pilus assembly protein PilM [Patescibacteria group bacterium]|nr:type IV pilus assembly protein PilM [Patescibacteria group bacterium]